MSNLKLSICIPTYNRSPFLRYLLTSFAEQQTLRFSYEIIISDNASSDDTTAVVQEFIARGLPIRYSRRETNGGAWANLANAFQLAEGEYALYMADDDLLVWEGLNEAIDHLDADPEMVMCQASWFLHDAITNTDLRSFYKVDKSHRFARGSFAPLFTFITDRHIFPEIAIYRTGILRGLYLPREMCFWAFSYLAQAIDVGAVGFLDKPFYRSVTRSPIARDREQAGHLDAMTSWDRYRGGLEYFIYRGALRGQFELSGPKKTHLDKISNHFMLNRMAVALRLWHERKEYITAYELLVRLLVNGFEKHPEVIKVRKELPRMAGLQTIARKVNASPDIGFLVVDGAPDPSLIGNLLRRLGMDDRIRVVTPPREGSGEIIGKAAVVMANEARRAHFVSQGYRPSLVFSDTDVMH